MKNVKMANGVEIPILGYGVYTITDEKECEQCVLDAIHSGFTHIDTAAIYMNEPAVGKAIKKSGVKREDLFITTKLWVQDQGYDMAKKAIDNSLKRLNLDYLDLYLIHEPMGDIYGQWRAMERAYKAGKIRAIGVSNMYADRLCDFLYHTEVKPVINQVRTNPYFQHLDTKKFEDENNIVHEAHSPFSQGDKSMFINPVLVEIAKNHNKTTGQIILHWLIQRGIVTLTRTTKKERMAENINIFDFELTEEEMNQIKSLDRPDGNSYDNRNPEVVKMVLAKRYEYKGEN